MSVLKKQDLRECFMEAKTTNAELVAVVIETRGSLGSEVIINPKVNFDSKLSYYNRAYNEDLVLNTCDGIKITGFCYGNNFKEIEAILNFEL